MIWARANSNVALVKYWGQTACGANQAANASLSVTLDGLVSVAGVRSSGVSVDRIAWTPPGPVEGLERFVAHARDVLGIRDPVEVMVTSNFPVGAGLASSASAYAALTFALAHAARAGERVDLAALARRGSGSACRSLYGGYVEWSADESGTVRQIASAEHWPLAVLVAITSEQPKSVSSRDGMTRTAATSPFYRAWLDANPADLCAVREAVLARDLGALGPVVERNAMRMHATALAADPALLYWKPATIAVVQAVWRLRESGVAAFFSIDAGPQVKVFCESHRVDQVGAELAEVPGVLRVLRSRPGGAPRVVSEPPAWVQVPPAWQHVSV